MRRSLSALVESSGVTSKALAARLGLVPGTFSNKLQGLRRFSIAEVRLLLRALNDVFRAQGRPAVAFEDIEFPEEKGARPRPRPSRRKEIR